MCIALEVRWYEYMLLFWKLTTNFNFTSYCTLPLPLFLDLRSYCMTSKHVLLVYSMYTFLYLLLGLQYDVRSTRILYNIMQYMMYDYAAYVTFWPNFNSHGIELITPFFTTDRQPCLNIAPSATMKNHFVCQC